MKPSRIRQLIVYAVLLSACFPVVTQALPNLTYYQPSGWSYPIVPSSVQGLTTANTTLYTGKPTYINWAVINNGNATPGRFYTCLYLDGTLINSWYTDNLYSNYYASITNWAYTVNSAGSHTLKIIADCYNNVGESNESDNSWQRTFTWQSQVTVQPPTVNFYADSPSITAGQSTILRWTTTNATYCSASGGWGWSGSTSGAQTVSPTATTTYYLTCSGPGGSSGTKSVTITVTSIAPPSLTFSAFPPLIAAGQSSVLQWSTTGAYKYLNRIVCNSTIM